MEAPVAVIDQSLTDQPRQPGRHFFRLWHTLFVSLANVLDDVRISDQMSTELSPVIRLHRSSPVTWLSSGSTSSAGSNFWLSAIQDTTW